MADTVELFVGGLSLEDVRSRIDKCTGLEGKPDEYGNILYSQPGLFASLSAHSYLDEGDLEFSSYTFELTAKNYRDPDRGGPQDSDAVRWFRQLFACLQERNDARLLLTYNLDYALERFDPTS